MRKTANHAAFPRLEIEDLGNDIAVNGLKTDKGVAILSNGPLEETS